jgi:uncharacterized protein YbjT (DUF2867 family)
MRVLVTGAYGLIGAACLARLHRDGHALVGAGRSIGEARQRFPFVAWREADFNHLTMPEAWKETLAGIDAVVNCVGVLQDGARDDVQRVQLDATVALFDACARAGIRRVIHVSAVGTEASAPTSFARTKAQAEDRLAQLDLDWVILRPALVLAPAAYGGTALLRALAALPGLVPLIAEKSRLQVVASEDVARTVALCLAPGAPRAVSWDLAHPQVLTLAEIVGAIRQWMGLRPARIVRAPALLARMVTGAADALGWLGWRSPARTTALAQLGAGVVGEPAAWIAATNRAPMSLADILAARPASVQDRWFARLYALKPIAVAGLAIFWLASGLVGLGPGRPAAIALLSQAGVSHGLAAAAVIAGSIVDIALGLAVTVRASARAALLGMLAVTGAYMVGGSVLLPALWLDPLGPLVKTLPVALATLFTLAILDER